MVLMLLMINNIPPHSGFIYVFHHHSCTVPACRGHSYLISSPKPSRFIAWASHGIRISPHPQLPFSQSAFTGHACDGAAANPDASPRSFPVRLPKIPKKSPTRTVAFWRPQALIQWSHRSCCSGNTNHSRLAESMIAHVVSWTNQSMWNWGWGHAIGRWWVPQGGKTMLRNCFGVCTVRVWCVCVSARTSQSPPHTFFFFEFLGFWVHPPPRTDWLVPAAGNTSSRTIQGTFPFPGFSHLGGTRDAEARGNTGLMAYREEGIGRYRYGYGVYRYNVQVLYLY